MIVFPHCKINLGLRILNRRPDGFHNIESVFYPVPWLDALEAVAAEVFSFQTFGLAIEGEPENNLCVRAYRLLQQQYELPAIKLCLLKNIPAGAGLGGGSSDAAFTLRLLNSLFKLNCSAVELKYFAAQLGSDCTFFLENKPCIVTGRGEQLQPVALDLSAYHIVVIKPNITINTEWAYSELSRYRRETGFQSEKNENSLEQLATFPVKNWNDFLKNDFEEIVFRTHPSLAHVKQQLYDSGAAFAAMSGSGSALFGIFERPPSIKFDASYRSYSGKLQLS